MEDAELARLDVPALLTEGVAARGKELFGNGAVAAAIILDNAGVIPRSVVFLAEIVRSGGAKYASELTEPLPTPAQTEVIRPWLTAAAAASASVEDDYTVEDWLKAVAAILAARRSARGEDVPLV
ncbi:hypothetical protein [Actinocrispum sp. NPDC049592]|uniref:hypothetical protein n=1 Tax=Actinocrispum sp. NPDC049592 TaxID=3154835 RepID=UPI00344A1A82